MKISELDYLNSSNTTIVIGVDQDSVPNKVGKLRTLNYNTINVVTIDANTTLDRTIHQGNVLAFSNTNTRILTVNTTNEFLLYKQCEIFAEGGYVSVSNGVGVIINRPSGFSNVIMQYGRALLIHTSSPNTYILTGELMPLVPDTAFNPLGNTISLSVTSTSSNTELYNEGSTLLIRNYGPNRAFVNRGSNNVVATVLDYAIEPYTIDYIYRDTVLHTHIGAVCANVGETASLSCKCGSGGH